MNKNCVDVGNRDLKYLVQSTSFPREPTQFIRDPCFSLVQWSIYLNQLHLAHQIYQGMQLLRRKGPSICFQNMRFLISQGKCCGFLSLFLSIWCCTWSRIFQFAELFSTVQCTDSLSVNILGLEHGGGLCKNQGYNWNLHQQ